MLAARLTLMGKCEEAIEVYCAIFGAELVEKSLFAEHLDQFPMGLPDNKKNLVFSAWLKFKQGDQVAYICFGDSPVLAFTGGNETQGCRDNVVFDMELDSPSEVERIFRAFMEGGAKSNVDLQVRGSYSRYCSFIDQFGICWNLYCRE